MFDVNYGGQFVERAEADTLSSILVRDSVFYSLFLNNEFHAKFAERILYIGKELKFMISDMDMERIRYRLLPFMSWDEHQGERGYIVRSVYFDDIYDSYLAENEAGTDY